MERIKAIGHNLNLVFARDLIALLDEQNRRLDEQSRQLDERAQTWEQAAQERATQLELRTDERIAAFEQRNDARADRYEQAIDQRFDERHTALEVKLDERHATFDQRITERHTRFDEWQIEQTQRAENFETVISARLAERELIVDKRLDERDLALDARLDERNDTFEKRMDARLDAAEAQATTRATNYETALDARLEERLVALEQRADLRFTELEARLEARLSEHLRLSDLRVDERLGKLERQADARFAQLEKQADQRLEQLERHTDERMERHERLLDGKLATNRNDIIDLTDAMLQIFDQRLDQQRRTLNALRAEFTGAARTSAAAAATNEVQASDSLTPAEDTLSNDLRDALTTAEPTAQIKSFRKLAGRIAPQQAKLATNLAGQDVALYHQILDWKKVAHEGLNDYSPDEQEIADYILSFIDDPAERHYTQQHLRRLLATLQRIPPPQTSQDRLLELGSLLHFVPALKKYSGYAEIHGADMWDTDAAVTHETLQQVHLPAGKGDTHTIELRNFNVEADPFPYPDNYFRVVLCCELIEHLQRDPLHMLWECNRVLQDGGYILLTTPNIISARSLEGMLIGCTPYLLSQYNRKTPLDQHNREYAPMELGIALAAAGFTVIELETEDVWLRSNPAIIKLLQDYQLWSEMRGDNLFALARKTSAPVERYPQELYVA